MTVIRDLFKVDKIFKNKKVIYIILASCIGTLIITALVVVSFTTWQFNSHDDLENWSYDEQDKWPNKFCRGSKHQSPVALEQRWAYKQRLLPIMFENFEKCDCLIVKNNGHTVMVYPTDTCSCQSPKLSGAQLTQNYTFANFHFHWPSEHTIDGVRYDLEAHFVFYADKYGSFENALNYPYGLTVMAVLFTETNYTASDNFRTIADAVKLIHSKPGLSSPTTKSINFHDFLPYDHEIYFTYEGSLTTPNCAEYVNWVVYKNVANISYLDLKDLTHIYDKHDKLVLTTNRSLQDINNRTIYIQEYER